MATCIFVTKCSHRINSLELHYYPVRGQTDSYDSLLKLG